MLHCVSSFPSYLWCSRGELSWWSKHVPKMTRGTVSGLETQCGHFCRCKLVEVTGLFNLHLSWVCYINRNVCRLALSPSSFSNLFICSTVLILSFTLGSRQSSCPVSEGKIAAYSEENKTYTSSHFMSIRLLRWVQDFCSIWQSSSVVLSLLSS